MITSVLMGGMGNQCFQYACGLAQARRLGVDLQLDVTHLQNGKRRYVLDQWDIDVPLVTGTTPTVYENGMGYNESINSVKDGDCLQGYWQSEKYFQDIKSDLKRLFVPRQEGDWTEKTIRITRNSVAIHIRRDDYLVPPHNEFHGVLPMSYYDAAREYILDRVPRPYFLVFCEDFNWATQNFSAPNTAIIQPGSESQDIYRMSLCEHAIIANSSFSWFGAWLGEYNPNRIVIAPSRWFLDPKARYDDIVPKRWAKIDA